MSISNQMVPSCERHYRAFRSQWDEFVKKRKNTVINPEVKRRIYSALLEQQDKYGPNYTPANNTELHQLARVHRNVYRQNFLSFYGVLLTVQAAVTIEMPQIMVGKLISYENYSREIMCLFEFFKLEPGQPLQVRHLQLSIALNRFPNEIWEAAFCPLYRFLAEEVWGKLSPQTRDLLFSQYVHDFCRVLKFWADRGFSSAIIEECKALLSSLISSEVQHNQNIERAINELTNK